MKNHKHPPTLTMAKCHRKSQVAFFLALDESHKKSQTPSSSNNHWSSQKITSHGKKIETYTNTIMLQKSQTHYNWNNGKFYFIQCSNGFGPTNVPPNPFSNCNELANYLILVFLPYMLRRPNLFLSMPYLPHKTIAPNFSLTHLQ